VKIAFVGTRGIPAQYGGFETAIEAIAPRLVARGHQVTVYCRTTNGAAKPSRHEGVELVWLPALRLRVAETLSHCLLSAIHLLIRRREVEAIILMNAANSPILPALRLAAPTAIHVDGLEWQRAKWGRLGRRYYRVVERLAAMSSAPLIADAQGIADYYHESFERTTVVIPYGASPPRVCDGTKVRAAGLEPKQYHLVVARFEPENHVREICAAYAASRCEMPLVVVGSAPYNHRYTAEVKQIARADDRIRLLGGVWDQGLLDDLYSNCWQYIHGHSVGGTNPSLLRAMAAGAPVAAYDVVFNREVLGHGRRVWATVEQLTDLLDNSDGIYLAEESVGVRQRVRTAYCWDDVASRYEALAFTLARE
jgi:glycosyltransferase involved in cell wall biosynthesis